MLRKTLSAGLCVLAFGAIGGALAAAASAWMRFSGWYVAGAVLFAAVVGYATWAGWVRARVTLGCLGCVVQPALFKATACDGQVFLWPILGAVVGMIVGRDIDRYLEDEATEPPPS